MNNEVRIEIKDLDQAVGVELSTEELQAVTGGQRMVPQTYRHVTVNAAQFDWSRLGSNSVSVVSNAVDGAGAVGRAFVTEYAGSCNSVGRWGISDARWDADSFRTAPPRR